VWLDNHKRVLNDLYGPGFLAVSHQQFVSLSQSSCVSPVKLLIDARGGGRGGVGAKSRDGDKA
jgi:hypothetical protein